MPLLALLTLSLPPAQATGPVKVAFLGNSYTSGLNLPGALKTLCQLGGHSAIVEAFAPAGNTLGGPQQTGAPHDANPESLTLIAATDWDYVVLQEQSVIPVIEAAKNANMKVGAAILAAAIEANDPSTTTLMFQTWARKNGGQFCLDSECSPTFATFDAMQDALTSAYREVARGIGAGVVPVGEAWRAAIHADPTIELFEPDGSHPSVKGNYLTACVFYAYIFEQSPIGFSNGEMAPEAALFLQRIAAKIVLGTVCAEYSSSGASASPILLEGEGDPSPGGDLRLRTTGLPREAQGSVILSSFAAASIDVAGGRLLVDPAKPLLAPRFLPAGATLAIPIYDDAQLAGVTLYFQALAAGPIALGPAALSNRLTLQFKWCADSLLENPETW